LSAAQNKFSESWQTATVPSTVHLKFVNRSFHFLTVTSLNGVCAALGFQQIGIRLLQHRAQLESLASFRTG
jgi:hypothetical protein